MKTNQENESVELLELRAQIEALRGCLLSAVWADNSTLTCIYRIREGDIRKAASGQHKNTAGKVTGTIATTSGFKSGLVDAHPNLPNTPIRINSTFTVSSKGAE